MKSALVLLAICGLVTAQNQLDLKTPVDRIWGQIEQTRVNPPDWEALPGIITKALECLSALSTFKVVSDRVPSHITKYVETTSPQSLANDLLKVDWKKVSEAGQVSQEQIQTIWDDLKEYMATADFVKIHDHLWNNAELIDLVKFLRDAGYTNIVEAIRGFYEAMDRADLNIPNIPASSESTPKRHTRSKRSLPQSQADLWPLIEQQGPVTKAECGLGEILALVGELEKSKLHEIVKLILYAVQEVIGNAGIHVLALKLGEPQKGAFIHDTLLLPEMADFLPLAQDAVLTEPGIARLNEILSQVLGLDLHNRELFKYILDLIQYLVWNYPFPQN